MKNIFVSTTFAKDDSKISDVLVECKKENISNVELGSNHIYEKDLKTVKENVFVKSNRSVTQWVGFGSSRERHLRDYVLALPFGGLLLVLSEQIF